MRAREPDDETLRLAALDAAEILDSPPERSFDDIVKLAQFICSVPIALVSLVAEDRQWFKARVGLALPETPRAASFCAHALDTHAPLIVSDTRADPRFADNPLVTAEPDIRFYAGVPIYLDGPGSAVGTLCVLDRVPRALTAEQMEALTALARRVEIELRLRARFGVRKPSASPPSRPDGERGPVLSEGELVAARYRIEALIGAGGMGEVYRAIDTQSGDRVALKIMTATATDDRDGVERFAREARALRRLTSAHVARFLDAGNLDSGAPFIVLEHLDGRELGRPLRPVAPPVAVDLLTQACHALTAAHAAGIIHRDLKPSNLFLSTNVDGTTTLKILDFGIAKVANVDDPAASPAAGEPLTPVTSVLGTPRYMSPEQLLSSRDVDETTDIWALGIIAYEMLTAQHPFDGETPLEICSRVFTTAPRSMGELVPDLTARLDEAVLRCLARDKADRWPSAAALRDALARAL